MAGITTCRRQQAARGALIMNALDIARAAGLHAKPVQHCPEKILEEIRARIVEVVSRYADLRPAGSMSYKALCPFHSEKTPSLSVHHERRRFHCFGCGAAGDVFSFIERIEGCTFPEAVAIAAKIARVRIRSVAETPVDSRRILERNARRGLTLWRADELQRIGVELRERDRLVLAAHSAVVSGNLTEDQVWDALESAYTGYSILEDRWDRLFRDEVFDAVSLWREFGPGVEAV